MELWIRSQDREQLIKVEKIMLIDDCLCCDEPQITHIETDGGVVGSYTKERALQIFDEIQNILQPRVLVHEPNINYDDMVHSLAEDMCLKTTQKVEMELKQAGQVVYQMPDE